MSHQFDFELKRPGCDRAVVLYHGLTATPIEMYNYGRALHKAGFDVFCHCLPGHGNTIADFKSVSWRGWLDFAIREFRDAKKTYAAVYVSGLCLGATLSIAVARTEAVSGIVALSTTLAFDGWAIPWYGVMLPFISGTLVRFYYLFPENDPYSVKNEETRAKVASMVKENVVALDCIPMGGFVELIKLAKWVKKNARYIKAPILFMHSGEDDLADIKKPLRLFKRLASPDKHFIILNNSYHLIVVDNESDFVMQKAAEFFSALYQRQQTGTLTGLSN